MNNHFTQVIGYDNLLETIVSLASIDTVKVEQMHSSMFEDQMQDIAGLANARHDTFNEISSLQTSDFGSNKRTSIEKAIGKYHKNLKRTFGKYTNYSKVGTAIQKENTKFMDKTKKLFLSETNENLDGYEGPVMVGYLKTFGDPKINKFLVNGGLHSSFTKIKNAGILVGEAKLVQHDETLVRESIYKLLFMDKHDVMTEVRSCDMRWVDSIPLSEVNRLNVLSYISNASTAYAQIEKITQELFNYLDGSLKESANAKNSKEFNRIIKENGDTARATYYYINYLRMINFMYMWTSVVHVKMIAGDPKIKLPHYNMI